MRDSSCRQAHDEIVMWLTRLHGMKTPFSIAQIYGKHLLVCSLLLASTLFYLQALPGDTPSNLEQCKNMLMGSFVGDAATMPVHWVYDQEELKKSANCSYILYHSPSICPFYTYLKGSFSPYGDESIPLMSSMIENPSMVFIKPRAVQFMLDFFKNYKGRLSELPKSFLVTKGTSSSDDVQAHGIVKVPLIVARYHNSPEVYKKI